MKKQLLALLLILVLLLSACGSAATEVPARQTHEAKAPSASDNAAPDEPAEEQAVQTPAAPDEEPSAAPGAPEIVILSVSDNRYDNALNVSFGTASASLLYCGNRLGGADYRSVADDADYPALAAALRAYSEETEARLRETLDSLEEYARGDYQYGNYPGAFDYNMVYTSQSKAWLVRADDTLVSFCVESYWNAGGAHPYTSHTGLNFDSRTGQQLAITDLLTEDGAKRFPELFEKALAEQYPYFMDGLLVESVPDAIRGEMDDGLLYFTVDEDGVTVMINPYDLAAYAAGPAFVRMFFSDYPGVFVPAYSAAHDEWVRQLRPQGESDYYSELNTLRYKNGVKQRELSVVYTPVDYHSGAAGSLAVKLDGAEWKTEDIYCFGVTPYLMRAEGRDLLYLEYSLPNDWNSLYIFDLSGEAPHLLDEIPEAFYSQIPTDPHGFWLSTRSYCMSTYTVMRLYSVSERGEASPLDELYTALRGPQLTLLQDMNMTLLTADGGERSVKVPAGEKLTIFRTDNRQIVDLISEKGEIYRVSYTRDADYMGEVNGVPLQEAFGGTFFAG